MRAFSSVFLPLAVAGVLALVVKPYYAWFLTRLKLRPALAVILVFAGGSVLVMRRGHPAWKLVGALTLICYAVFIAFAVVVWL